MYTGGTVYTGDTGGTVYTGDTGDTQCSEGGKG